MPRQARLDAPGTLHQIRGIERSPIFKDGQDRQDFISSWRGQSVNLGISLFLLWSHTNTNSSKKRDMYLHFSIYQGVHNWEDIYFWKSPLTPLFQRGGFLPFAKGGKEGFGLQCLYNYGLISNWGRGWRSAPLSRSLRWNWPRSRDPASHRPLLGLHRAQW